MNLLLEHFHELTRRPELAAKLKDLILQLAIQGKLVPQDPADEPASELLKRIQAEKERLVEAGEIRKEKPLPEIQEDEIPFELPEGWVWCRISHVTHNWGQKKPDRKFTYIDVSSIDNETGKVSEDVQILNPSEAPSRARKIVKKNCVIYSTVRPYLLNIAIINGDFEYEPIVSTAFAVLNPMGGCIPHYVYYYLRSPVFVKYVESQMTGMAYPAINDKNFQNGYIPLPPLNEQKRIVAKVESLLQKVDETVSRAEKTRQTRIYLGKAALQRISNGISPGELRTGWRRIEQHFSDLFSAAANVQELRQTILQLAVQGKLVPQDPADEPASELLKRIQAEKERLIEAGEIRKEKPLPVIGEDEIPFELPRVWVWCRLIDISNVGTGATPSTGNPEYWNGNIPWITSSSTGKSFISEADKYITELALEKTNCKILPKHTLIFALYGQGKTRGQISEILIETTTNQACASIELIDLSTIHRKYIKFLFVQKYNDIRALSAGGAQPNLNLTKLKLSLIPLPPLNEQKRIVAKVESLMQLCDQLEGKIGSSEQVAERLVDVLIQQKVARGK